MSNIDKIRQEIERQKEINKRLLDGQLREGCLYAFNQVLSFLDSLPEQEQEQPVKGLKEAAEEYATKWHKRLDGSEWKSIFPKAAIRDFIAGAEWQKAKILEWAKERYQQTISNVGCYTGHSVWTEVIDKLTEI